MITSEDIRRVTFDRTMRGYRCEDVNDYLKQVADSMDALAASNEELQKKLVVLAQRIEQYRAEEDTLRTTMLNAQRLGENVIRESKQKAAEIIRAANIKAEDTVQRGRDEVELARQELITVRREADEFKKSLLDMYRKHIRLLSQIPEYNPEEHAAAVPEEEPVIPSVREAEPVTPAYTQPEYSPEPVYEAPAPTAAPPAPVPPAPAPVAAPAVQEPVVEVAPEEPADTVEFAIPGDTTVPPAYAEPEPEARFQPGAGLYDEAPEPPAKKPVRRKSRAKAKPQPQPEPQDDLPAAFDSFESVDL